MSPSASVSAAAPLAARPPGPTLVQRAGLLAGFLALLVVVLLPGAEGLPPAGQAMLGILAFAVIVWMTDALDCSVSAVVIAALMIFLLAFAPAPGMDAGDMGTGAALNLALPGFASSAVASVGAACVIAATMTATGLDRRIALAMLSRVPACTGYIVIGAMVVGPVADR